MFESSIVVRVDYDYYLGGFVVMRMGTGRRKSKEEDDSSEDAGSFPLSGMAGKHSVGFIVCTPYV